MRGEFSWPSEIEKFTLARSLCDPLEYASLNPGAVQAEKKARASFFIKMNEVAMNIRNPRADIK